MATPRDDKLYIAFGPDTTNDELVRLLVENERYEAALERLRVRLDELPDPPLSMRIRFRIEDQVSRFKHWWASCD